MLGLRYSPIQNNLRNLRNLRPNPIFKKPQVKKRLWNAVARAPGMTSCVRLVFSRHWVEAIPGLFIAEPFAGRKTFTTVRLHPRTTGMELATRRTMQQARDLAGQFDPLGHCVRIRTRVGRQQSRGVGMAGTVKNML